MGSVCGVYVYIYVYMCVCVCVCGEKPLAVCHPGMESSLPELYRDVLKADPPPPLPPTPLPHYPIPCCVGPAFGNVFVSLIYIGHNEVPDRCLLSAFVLSRAQHEARAVPC